LGSIKSKTRTFAGRFANRFVPDNPTSDTAVQSTIKTTKTAIKAKKTYTNVKMTLLNTEKVIHAIIGKLNTAPIVKIAVIAVVLFI